MQSRTKFMDELMDEHIRMVGVPGIIVTRDWMYQWLKERGWNPSERGFASLDYVTFRQKPLDEPLTDPEHRDFLLNQIAAEYQR